MKILSPLLLLSAAIAAVQGQNVTNTSAPLANETMAPTFTMVPAETGNTTNTTNNDMIVTLVPLNSTTAPGNNIFDQNNNNDGLITDDANTTTLAPTNTNTTMAPTAYVNTRSNEICNQLDPGDVFIYVVASDDPDGIGFLALEDIPGPLTLLMTDNPWMGTQFGTMEGVLSLQVPTAGFAMGSNFGYGFDYGANNDDWTREAGTFNFGVAGDSVILYCEGINGTINPLVGFTNMGSWAEPGLAESEYGASDSALPVELQLVGRVSLPHLDNYEYKGPTGLNKTALQAAMMDPENWEGSDDGLGDQSSAIRGSSRQSLLMGVAGGMMAIFMCL